MGRVSRSVALPFSLALIAASAIGVLAGTTIAQYVSERTLHMIAGIGFIGIGIWTLFR